MFCSSSAVKAQSAIEYLMTYGWMLLVVAIVGGAIFSMTGSQGIENVSGFEGEALQISDFGLNPVGISVLAENREHDQITISKIKLVQDEESRSIPLKEELSSGENAVINIPGVKESTESNTIDVELITDRGSLENITVNGEISGSLELDRDIQGFWTFSEEHAYSDEVLDLSGNENHGEIIGTLDWEDTSLGDKPVFTEMNYLRAESQEFLDIDEDITLSAWVKAYEKDDDNQDYILDYRGSTGDGYYLMHGASSEDQDFQFRYYESRLYSGLSPEIDEVYHVLGRYSDGQMEIYVNNTLVDSRSASPGDTIDADMLTIGNSHRESQNFEGVISNVRVYDRALSSDAIEFLYQNPGIVN